MMEPGEGLFIFRAEGNNDRTSRDYSGKIHCPGISSHCADFSSGVTIGRGYDSGSRSGFEVLADLSWAGVSRQQAERIAEGSGLRGCQAAAFVRKNKILVKLLNHNKEGYLRKFIRFITESQREL